MKSKKIIIPLVCLCMMPVVTSCDPSGTMSVTEGEFDEIMNTVATKKTFVAKISHSDETKPDYINGTYVVNENAESVYNYVSWKKDVPYEHDYTIVQDGSSWHKYQRIGNIQTAKYEQIGDLTNRDTHHILDLFNLCVGKYSEAEFKRGELNDSDYYSYLFKTGNYTLEGTNYITTVALGFSPMLFKDDNGKLYTKPYISEAKLKFYKEEQEAFVIDVEFLTALDISVITPKEEQIIPRGQVKQGDWEAAIDKFKVSVTKKRNFSVSEYYDGKVTIYDYNEPFEKVSTLSLGETTWVKTLKTTDNNVLNVVNASEPNKITFCANQYQSNAQRICDELCKYRSLFNDAKYNDAQGTYTFEFGSDKIEIAFNLKNNTVEYLSSYWRTYYLYDFEHVEKIEFPKDAKFSQKEALSVDDNWNFFTRGIPWSCNYRCKYKKTVDGTIEQDNIVFEMGDNVVHKVNFYNSEGKETSNPDYYKHYYSGDNYFRRCYYVEADNKYVWDQTQISNENQFTVKAMNKTLTKDYFTHDADKDVYNMNESGLKTNYLKACQLKVSEDGTLNIIFTTDVEGKDVVEEYTYFDYQKVEKINLPIIE